MWTFQTVLLGLNTLAVAGLGAAWLFGKKYGEAYMAKKGENLARKEDIADLVREVRAVTAATKEIETRLSGELWNRQKVWEIKRELLFSVAEKEMEATIALTWCCGVKGEKKKEALLGFVKALDEFCIAIGMTVLVCSQETKEELDNVFYVLAELSKQVQDDENSDLDFTKGEYSAVTEKATRLVRKELGIDS